MGRFDTIKTTIDANIKENGNQEITGQKMNSVLTEMINATDAEITELESEVSNLNELQPWSKVRELDGAITGSGLNYDFGKYKAYGVAEGDKITIKGGISGSYAAFVTNLPTSTTIPYVEGQVRLVITPNVAQSFIVPNGAKYILIESTRSGENTKPLMVLINDISITEDSVMGIMDVLYRTAKSSVFTTLYGNKVDITNSTIRIPAKSRILVNGKSYYQNESEVVINRNTSATVEFIIFDIRDNSYKSKSYGEYDARDTKSILCFFVYFSDYCCSLPEDMYTFNGVVPWLKRVSFPNSIIVPPNDTRIVIADDTITIPAFTRLYYWGKVFRTYSELVIPRVATNESSYSEELLVFDTKTNEYKCLGGGEYANATESVAIVCGLKKGNGGTTLSSQISSSNEYSELCVAYGKKISITDVNITIPSGSRIFYKGGRYDVSSDVILTRGSGAQHTFVMFDYVTKEIYVMSASTWDDKPLSSYMLFWVSYANECSLNPILYTINGQSVIWANSTDILDLNPKPEVESRLIPQTKNKSKDTSSLTLLHFSDLHGDTTNLARIVQFRNAYDAYIDDAIHTGDAVGNTIADANPFEKVEGAESILNVIGNHEAWVSTDIPDYTATEKECYDKMFAPSIANWGVVQPSNAVTDGKCYYYKDYTEQEVRLIVLDSVHWHTRGGVTDNAAEQKSWFVNVLSEAKEKGYMVIAAMHYPPVNGVELVQGTGFTKYYESTDAIIGDGWYAADEIFSCVDNFINQGGKFSTWLIGHTHIDVCGFVKGHNQQFVVVIQSASRSYTDDFLVKGTKTQDAFNIISIDASHVKITRIGNDMDVNMQSKKTICYDYISKKKIYNL